jgi:hypothetical protein
MRRTVFGVRVNKLYAEMASFGDNFCQIYLSLGQG